MSTITVYIPKERFNEFMRKYYPQGIDIMDALREGLELWLRLKERCEKDEEPIKKLREIMGVEK